ncbi:hypothetical protein LENED_006770 [Lentinula edodes]|uniref:Uncharacterized protein n=1 Tax=Lentinula edodes TaxID=5353 RepID=A0A1Q3ECL1_LENED|nr:hypothetical protein LENED_006770 [Lentinula edodes]
MIWQLQLQVIPRILSSKVFVFTLPSGSPRKGTTWTPLRRPPFHDDYNARAFGRLVANRSYGKSLNGTINDRVQS